MKAPPSLAHDSVILLASDDVLPGPTHASHCPLGHFIPSASLGHFRRSPVCTLNPSLSLSLSFLASFSPFLSHFPSLVLL